jgi:hypothetical protein
MDDTLTCTTHGSIFRATSTTGQAPSAEDSALSLSCEPAPGSPPPVEHPAASRVGNTKTANNVLSVAVFQCLSASCFVI